MRRSIVAGIVTSILVTAMQGSPALATSFEVDRSGVATGMSRAAASECANTVELVRTEALTADGRVADGAADEGQARRYVYNLDGSTVSQTLPPDDFDPLHASVAELRAYSFPPRPANPARLAQWAQLRPGKPGLCVGKNLHTLRQTASATAAAPISRNWAGEIVTGSGFTSSETEWNQTGFTVAPNCGGLAKSGYSTWSGIGGYSGNKALMQSGTDVAGSGVNDIYMWWEMLNTAHPNPEIIFTNSTASGGDDIAASTVYDGRTVTLNVSDYTTEQYYSTDQISSYAGDPTTKYYNGTSTESITESPSPSNKSGTTVDGFKFLRKPSNANIATTFIGSYTNNKSSSYYNDQNLRQVDSKGRILQTSGYYPDNNGGWADTWQSCGYAP